MISRFKDRSIPEHPVAKNEADKIMHISLPICKNSMIMGSYTPEYMRKHNEHKIRSKILISAESKEEAALLLNELSVGAKVDMPIADSP